MSHHDLGRAVALLVDAQSGALGVTIDFLQKAQKDPTWIIAMQMCLEKQNPWPTDTKSIVAPVPVLWKKVNATTILVNLDYDLNRLSNEVEIVSKKGSGWATVELRVDELFVDGKRVILWLSEEQKNGPINGNELRPQIENSSALDPNILDALVEAWRQGFRRIPMNWSCARNTQGQTWCICFWGKIFRHADGNFYVRGIRWHKNRWRTCYYWLGGVWGEYDCAAMLEG